MESQRVHPSVAVTEASAGAFPLAPLPPVFALRIQRKGRPGAAAESWLVALPDSKLRLLAPGVYRITSHVVLETDLTLEQLQEIIEPATAPRPELSPEEEAQKRERKGRAHHLAAMYRAKLDDGPEALEDTFYSWLGEFTEDELRAYVVQTASEPSLKNSDERYEFLKQVVKGQRRERARAQKKQPKR